jgi:hypothetical protein
MKKILSRLRPRVTPKKSNSNDLGPFVTRLNFDCRSIIYGLLVSQELHIECYNPKPSHLAGLASTCVFLKDEIEHWYQLKSNQAWLTTMPSAKLGIFAPEKTTFHFDLNYRYTNLSSFIQRLNQQTVNRNKFIRRIQQAPEFENIRHLVIHSKPFFQEYPYKLGVTGSFLKALKRLSSIEFVLHVNNSWVRESLCCDLWDMWRVFWGASSFCHPKECCSCCVLPELKWAVYYKGDKYSGEAPFWNCGPLCSSSGFGFKWTMYQTMPHFDEYQFLGDSPEYFF